MKPLKIKDLLNFPNIKDLKYIRGSDKLIWHVQENDFGKLYLQGIGSKPVKISGEFNVRGSLGYGGAAFDVGETIVLYTDSNHRLLKTNVMEDAPFIPLTPAFEHIAAPVISPDEKWTLFIAENNDIPSIAVVDTQGFIWPQQLAMGADFYMQPVWHPDGESIAWVEWDHPHMPWNGSRVKIGKLAGMRLRLSSETLVAGVTNSPASQPIFSPDGKWLSYLQKNGNWDDLVLFNLEKKTRISLIHGDGFHLKLPEWVQGMRSYAWSPDSRTIFHFRYKGPLAELWQVDVKTKESGQIDIAPITWATQITISESNESLSFLGSSLSIPEKICELKSSGKGYFHAHSFNHVLKSVELQSISLKTGKGGDVHGIFFPPAVTPKSDDHPPPLVVHVHSGPTSLSGYWFNKNIPFFTSRGFAFAMLNYRGSSGFGYEYQNALREQWGIVDVEDAAAFTRQLIKQKLVDENRIAIMGSSAGGFSVLNALIQLPDIFKAGICSYGVSDLVEDAKNTHKFERFYHQFLIGKLDSNLERFKDRSPINHIDAIKNPVLLFHGTEDCVVGIEQTQKIYHSLKKRNIPSRLVVYEGEGHGFRNLEHILDFYQQIEVFLNQFLN